nr:transposase, mutator type [Tanacetum cinerariifolium]
MNTRVNYLSHKQHLSTHIFSDHKQEWMICHEVDWMTRRDTKGRTPKSLTLENPPWRVVYTNTYLDVNRNVRKEWEKVSSKSSSIGKVMKKLSKEQPASSVARPYVAESDVDPFDGLDEILGDYANTGNESTWKQMVVHVALKQGFRACGREILGLDGCFMPGPWPGQMLTTVGVDANNGIYPVAYAIVEAKSKASWCWFLNLLGEDLGIEPNLTTLSFLIGKRDL